MDTSVFVRKSTYIFIFMFVSMSLFSQTTSREKMKQLSFLTGDWVGTSTSYEDGEPRSSIPAFENIKYMLDSSILVIDLQSEALQLHTVIYYDEVEGTYYYNPFYEKGAGKYPASFEDKKLIVTPSETKRFIFTVTDEGDFLEYGEILVDWNWVIYFKDVFSRSN